MRVAFFAHDSGMFGAQRTLLTLLQHLDQTAFEPLVIVPGPGPFVDEVRSIGLPLAETARVRWVPDAGNVNQFGRRYWLKRFVSGLHSRASTVASLIERYGIDLVYTNTIVAAEGAWAAWRCGVPHLWHIHEPLAGNPELGPLLPPWLYSLAVDRLSDTVVFCSGSLAKSYPGLVDRGRVVFNGLPEARTVDRQQARMRICSEFEFPRDCTVVAVVGAIQPRKDHATFLRAARRLAAQRPEVRFLIVGGDVTGGAADLHRQISALGLTEVVRVAGWWPDSIHELLAGIDILAVSSIQESFGLTVVEAFAVETPVVSTQCGGPEEVIRDGVDGYLVPVGDDEALAQRLLRLVERPREREVFGVAGKARFQAQFTVAAYVSQLQVAMSDTVALRKPSMRGHAAALR